MPKASRFIRDKAEDGIGDNGEDGQPNDGIDTAAKVNKVIRETNGGGCREKGKGHIFKPKTQQLSPANGPEWTLTAYYFLRPTRCRIWISERPPGYRVSSIWTVPFYGEKTKDPDQMHEPTGVRVWILERPEIHRHWYLFGMLRRWGGSAGVEVQIKAHHILPLQDRSRCNCWW